MSVFICKHDRALRNRMSVRDDPTLLDDGREIPKSQGRGWRFDSRLWNLPLYVTVTCKVVCCLLCFGVGMLTFCLKKIKKRNRMSPWRSLSLSLFETNLWSLGCGISSLRDNNLQGGLIYWLLCFDDGMLTFCLKKKLNNKMSPCEDRILSLSKLWSQKYNLRYWASRLDNELFYKTMIL